MFQIIITKLLWSNCFITYCCTFLQLLLLLLLLLYMDNHVTHVCKKGTVETIRAIEIQYRIGANFCGTLFSQISQMKLHSRKFNCEYLGRCICRCIYVYSRYWSICETIIVNYSQVPPFAKYTPCENLSLSGRIIIIIVDITILSTYLCSP